jgi:hypothetical protein
VGDGVGQEIFGALGTGGLEEIGDDEDEDGEDLGQDGMGYIHSLSSSTFSLNLTACVLSRCFQEIPDQDTCFGSRKVGSQPTCRRSKDSEIGCKVLEGKG